MRLLICKVAPQTNYQVRQKALSFFRLYASLSDPSPTGFGLRRIPLTEMLYPPLIRRSCLLTYLLIYFQYIIIIIIINEEIIVAFSPKTTRTRYKVKKHKIVKYADICWTYVVYIECAQSGISVLTTFGDPVIWVAVCVHTISTVNKMLSYRRETALQHAL